MTWKLPFPDKFMTGAFGTRSKYRIANNLGPHRGTDYAPGVNKIIPSIAPGTLRLLQWSNVLGWVAVYSAWHDGKTWYIGYCHLSCAKHGPECKGPKKLGAHSPFTTTKVGDKKELGEPVGRVGNTGSASSGAHCHITLSRSLKGVFYGKVYDIREYVQAMSKKPPTSRTAPQKFSKPTKKVCPTCKRPL
jgi:murein DD-endopeptidase MepM/ murein hydrolase activator NlpD